MAVLMPTSWPSIFTSAPPELPGLIAASVWIASITVFWLSASPLVDTGRSSAETIPEVTVPARPSGEPIATTGCPTCRFAEVPSSTGVRSVRPATLMTAMSDVGSAPTTVAGAVVPSENATVSLPFGPAPAATWLLVRISPSEDRMMPDPSPCARAPTTSIYTTLGSTFAATACTEPAGALTAAAVDALGALSELTTATPPFCEDTDFAPTTPPMPPLTSASAMAPATIAVRPRRGVTAGWGTGFWDVACCVHGYGGTACCCPC